MTTHQNPAQLPPDRVQAIEDSVARYRHELTQAHVAAAEWQRQCEQHEADLVKVRGELARLRRALLDAVARIEAAEQRADAAERRAAVLMEDQPHDN